MCRAVAVPHVVPQQQVAPPPIPTRTVWNTVKEVAFRILFPFVTLWMLSAVVPIAFEAVVVLSGVIGATFVAAFFSQTPRPPVPLSSTPSLIAPCAVPAALQAPQRSSIPMGLQNNGTNTCFLNALLQGLRFSPSIMEWIRTDRALLNDRRTSQFEALRNFYNDHAAWKPWGALALREAFRRASGFPGPEHVNDTSQRDIQEALINLLRWAPPGLKGVDQETNLRRGVGEPPHTNEAQEFSLLKLDIPAPHLRQPDLFNQMVRAYFEDRHPLGGALAVTQHTLLQVPDTLFVHIARFTQALGKDETPVPPPERLTLPIPGGNATWELKVTYNHEGPTPNAGHYWSCGVENGIRWCYNDERVYQITDVQYWKLQQSQAYVLQYERVR